MGPFNGYRAWRIACPREGKLRAVVAEYTWDGPVLTVPDADWEQIHRGKGFHSHRNPAWNYQYVHNTLLLEFSPYYDHPLRTEPHDVVLGTVRHYGLVAEYERGFRSSQVLVTSLSVPRVWDEGFCKLLADRYQCEVTQYDAVPNPKDDLEKQLRASLSQGNSPSQLSNALTAKALIADMDKAMNQMAAQQVQQQRATNSLFGNIFFGKGK